MPAIADYRQFNAIHWDTGALRNVLAHQGVVAPHTGEPFSEALLFGVAGGISVLYFVFEYEGYPPHVYLGTRSPEDLIPTACARLGIPMQTQETASADKAARTLAGALAARQPAMVWAGVGNLPYNGLPLADFPAMFPIVVYGTDEAAGQVQIADRARVPLTVTPAEAGRRSCRAGQHKAPADHVWRTSGPGCPARCRGGGHSRLHYTIHPGLDERPQDQLRPGCAAKWAGLIADPRDKKGWPHLFPPGRDLYAALVTIFQAIETMGTGGGAARPLYAAFLDEAAVILDKPALRPVAEAFRADAAQWTALAAAMLPAEVPSFKETRDLLLRRRDLFVTQGMDSLDERRAITARLETIKREMAESFPLNEGDVAAFREELRIQIMAVHDTERAAVVALQEVIG